LTTSSLAVIVEEEVADARRGKREKGGHPVSEENKALVRREIDELFNHTGNLDVAEEVYASDFVGHDTTMPEGIHGIEGARQFAAGMRSVFPDLNCTIEDQIAEGDKVVSRWSASGTHQGETEEMGPPRATGWR
jgi:predicted ester cyclase